MKACRELSAVKKAEVGEAIVDSFLKSKKVVPYRPVYDGTHPFDRLCATTDKKTLYGIEIKSKARRTYYNDTGINVSHYNDYQNIQQTYGIEVFIVFVDEYLKQIYGGRLSSLDRPCTANTYTGKNPHLMILKQYPSIEGGIIYFPCSLMQKIADL